MNEVIIVNKEKDMTSRDVVNKICKIFNTKKVGHTGTLDPLATGVLLVCLNRYTKLVDEITCLDKEYIAKIKLGFETDTLDITGKIINKCDVLPSLEQLKDVIQSFKGKSIQEVPKYSAIKINGKKLYEYARENIEIDLPKHEIEVFDIELLEYINDEITIRCHVSKGTYIRSLVRDIAYKLNTLGTMSELIRTKQGKFKIENSYTLEQIKNNEYQGLSLKDIFSYPRVNLSLDEYKKVKNGSSLEKDLPDGLVILYYNDKEIAIYDVKNKFMKLKILIDI